MNLAFLFPGQGSQSSGMLAEHARKYKQIKATFKEASDVLGQDLFKLLSKDSEGELNLTVNAQPLMLAASVGIWRVWTSLSEELPDIVSGHSLGEYSALTCAGVFDFADAVRVVRRRAELMQKAVPVSQGLMAAVIGIKSERFASMCREASRDSEGSIVEAVNFNTGTQTVVAGHAAAVKRLLRLAKLANARRCTILPVSVPAHSSLLKGISREFGEFLASVPMEPPNVPVLHSTDVAIHSDPQELRKALVRQIYTPVRWLETINTIIDRGVLHFVEIGPGRVLTGLNRHIDKAMSVFSTETPAQLEKALNTLEI